MKKNEGRADRWLRILLGGLLLAFGLGPMAGFGGVVASLIGLVAIVTGFFGWCPAYKFLGISTCPRE